MALPPHPPPPARLQPLPALRPLLRAVLQRRSFYLQQQVGGACSHLIPLRLRDSSCPPPAAPPQDGKIAYGGYSSRMVVDQQFCLQIPKNLPLDRAAPLLCAGVTVWSPMKARA